MRLVREFGFRLSAVAMVAALLAGCGEGDPLGPDAQIEVNKGVNTFLFTVWYMEDGTDTLIYSWENTATQASVDITDGISSGSAILVIKDADGTVVYQDDIADDPDGDTAVGVAGTWTIEMRIQNATGNFIVSIIDKT